jgi:cytoskeletal protein CcmA (bactofilin family)
MIFRSSKDKAAPPAPLVDGAVELKGEMAFNAAGVLHGRVEGTISGSHTLIVAADAEVRGGIKAGALELQGKMEGWVNAERGVVLDAGSEFAGPVQAGALEVREGARYRGVVKVVPEGA